MKTTQNMKMNMEMVCLKEWRQPDPRKKDDVTKKLRQPDSNKNTQHSIEENAEDRQLYSIYQTYENFPGKKCIGLFRTLQSPWLNLINLYQSLPTFINMFCSSNVMEGFKKNEKWSTRHETNSVWYGFFFDANRPCYGHSLFYYW